ncbi:MAG: tagaturonate reductase [Saprospiraceae bacterium]
MMDTNLKDYKIAQFGTGVLLRGLIDYIFQKGIDSKRLSAEISMIKSTSSDTALFTKHNCNYIVVESGIDDHKNNLTHYLSINCITEIISAGNEWQKLESLFKSDQLKLVVSNVTEAGLIYQLSENEQIPTTYPAKLTRLLYTRFEHFKGDQDRGIIIVPTELLVNNGSLLKSFVIKHAEDFKYGTDFLHWLNTACIFCNSLVDRIVPGKWVPKSGDEVPEGINELTVATELFYLWAIEGGEKVMDFFSFKSVVPGLVVTENIEAFREQKLRLLNGCHTLLSPIAYGLGCKTVEEMMNSPLIIPFFEQLCEREILPSLKKISPDARSFYKEMKNRWLNPFIRHELKSILSQTVLKMQTRNGETINRFYAEFDYLPPFLTFGFSIFIWVYRPNMKHENIFSTLDFNQQEFEFNDQKAALLFEHWEDKTSHTIDIISSLLADTRIFDHSFVALPGFKQTVLHHVSDLESQGLKTCIVNFLN